MSRVPMELEKGKLFDRRVTNDNLDRAVKEVLSIVNEYLSSTRSTYGDQAD
jgi:guanylate kinase